MATDVRLATLDLTSDATFRAWCAAVDAALLAVGLVAAGDTGQMNLATAVRPGTINTAAGYRMYRFADALQATKPVFIKVEFGTGGATTVAGAWATVANGTNGAGTLTGQVGARIQWLAVGSNQVAPHTLRTSGDTSRVAMAVMGGGQYGFLLGVERSKADDGADNGDGIQMVWKNNAGVAGGGSVWVGTPGAATSTAGIPALVAPATATSAVYGSDTGVFPVTIGAGRLRNPGLNFLGAMVADLPADSEVDVPMYGVARHYRSIGAGPGNIHTPFGTPISAVTTTNVIPLMRWE